MTPEKIQKFKAIVRRIAEFGKTMIDGFAEIAIDVLSVLAEPERGAANVAQFEPSQFEKTADKLLTVDEAAELLRVTPQTVYQWKRVNKIPFQQVNRQIRFSEKALQDWIANQPDNKAAKKTKQSENSLLKFRRVS